MKIFFKLNHPAHYHLFKNIIKKLKSNGNSVIIAIKNKDILRELLDINNIQYINIVQPQTRKAKNKFSVIKANALEIFQQDLNLYKILRKESPDILMGTDIAIAHTGWLLGIPSYIFNEDDISVNKLFCYFTYPFAKYIVAPGVCDVGRFINKKIAYNGYQKLAYLHPNHFVPDINIVKKYVDPDEKFYLLRLVNFTAGHDIEGNHGGITSEIMDKIIKLLSENGRVFITSEGELDSKYQDYMLKINPTDIHHILSFAELFISDSQSMTVEAAMLGTPSIRFNSFAGKISVLNEIETRYELSIGISNQYPQKLLETIQELLNNKNLRKEISERREFMLSEKIDVTEFTLNLIKNRRGV
ncbi:MAG TPA: DUF354 domain-containing protein [Ignavibacteriaceae bacterium]|nr:DUF354 domain-containing protein [Ignavibacteriaceae bacterium]